MMSTLTCDIVDDEPLATELLANYIQKLGHLQLVYTSNDATMAYQHLMQQKVDLLFWDIQMPELTGMQLLKLLQDRFPVILTTAYVEYALEGVWTQSDRLSQTQ